MARGGVGGGVGARGGVGRRANRAREAEPAEPAEAAGAKRADAEPGAARRRPMGVRERFRPARGSSPGGSPGMTSAAGSLPSRPGRTPSSSEGPGESLEGDLMGSPASTPSSVVMRIG